MDDLIARLSAGERWDGDNAEVLRALGWYPNLCDGKPTGEWCNGDGYWGWPDKRPLPQPLDSVDDALRLVPEGWMTHSAGQFPEYWAWILCQGSAASPLSHGKAPTAAIALTIAILEASRG